MMLIWLVLGMFIDSASIMLLTVPIFAPIADTLGFHPYASAMMGILAIEADIQTPPFGLCVYTVKACLPPDDPCRWHASSRPRRHTGSCSSS